MSVIGSVIDQVPPPLLRGWLHAICFFLSLPAGTFVVAAAHSWRGRASALVYAVGVSALFGVSGLYHRRRWSPPSRAKMKRLDHATIFVMIAATYTPLCAVAVRGTTGTWVLVVAWIGAGAGAVLALVGIAERPVIGLVCYISLGWVAVIVLPELARRASTADVVLILVGGVIYTVGAIGLGSRWPDLSPSVFGYHEAWHVMVVGAVVCHYVAVLSIVRTLG